LKRNNSLPSKARNQSKTYLNRAFNSVFIPIKNLSTRLNIRTQLALRQVDSKSENTGFRILIFFKEIFNRRSDEHLGVKLALYGI
jgi:hypothetical protein